MADEEQTTTDTETDQSAEDIGDGDKPEEDTVSDNTDADN